MQKTRSSYHICTPTQWVVKVGEFLAPFLAEALLGASGSLVGLDFLFILLSL